MGKQDRDLFEFDREAGTISARCRKCRTVNTRVLNSYETGRAKCPCQDPTTGPSAGERLLSLVAEKGGKLLDENVFGASSRNHFECKYGHRWSSTTVLYGTWCFDCGGQTRRTIEELAEVAKSRGGRLISTEYRGTESKYEFECSLGHQFTNGYRHIADRGQWCPTCNKPHKSEEISRVCMEDVFDAKFPKKRPKWLRNSRGRQMELDGYCEELSLAFEYQGLQHFQEGSLYGSGNLQRRTADDERKRELCQEHGVRLFYFTCFEDYQDFANIAIRQAENFGPEVRALVKSETFDINRAYIRDDRIHELRALLAKKNIRVLDEKWITSDYKYHLECLTCGHKWRAVGNAFFNSRKVAGCQPCGWASVAENNRHSMKELRAFAAQYGGKVLSSEYVHAQSKYEFECANGHKFIGKLNNMTARGQFCPKCEGRAERTFLDDKQAALAFEKHGYKLVGRFNGTTKRAEIVHNLCGTSYHRSLHSVDHSPSCRVCSLREKTAEAEALWAENHLLPLEPYSGKSSAKWKSRCMVCNSETSPIFQNVKRGQGGCRTCYLRNRNK